MTKDEINLGLFDEVNSLKKQLQEAKEELGDAQAELMYTNVDLTKVQVQLRAQADLLERFDVAVEVMFQCGGEIDSSDRKNIMKIVSDYNKLKTKTGPMI